MTSNNLKLTALAVMMALAAGNAQAGTDASAKAPVSPAVAPVEKSVYDKIWGITKLYSNKESSFIQDISLSGRAQFEYFNVDSDQGNADDWEVRRLRFGTKVKMFNKWLLHVEADFNPQDPHPFYNKLTDAFLQYSANDQFIFGVGKQSVKFGLDGGTSSKELITIDRSNLANNLWFTEEYAPGITMSGSKGNWSYFLGWFTSDGNPEFGEVR